MFDKSLSKLMKVISTVSDLSSCFNNVLNYKVFDKSWNFYLLRYIIFFQFKLSNTHIVYFWYLYRKGLKIIAHLWIRELPYIISYLEGTRILKLSKLNQSTSPSNYVSQQKNDISWPSDYIKAIYKKTMTPLLVHL